MAVEKGFIKCPERHCSEIAEVMQAGGKRSTLYTKCPACGTNQGNGVARQKYLSENLKVSREEVEAEKEVMFTGKDFDPVPYTEEKAAIPSKNAASDVSDDAEPIPSEKPKKMPKGTLTAPPIFLGALALFAALMTAIFTSRKPKIKHTEKTA